MAAPEVHHLFHHPIADHSFSADRQTLAVARENNVDLYARSGSGFKLQDELTGHDKTVTGVDIAPNSGKIVTCSQGEFGALEAADQAANDVSRPQCLRLGTLTARMEAYSSASPHQPCCHMCPLGSL
jgi:WD40 repeat protein